MLAPEPTDETLSAYFGASAYWKCAEATPELLTAVSPSHRSALAGNYISYLQERVSICLNGQFPRGEGAYAKSAFDENGNMKFYRAGNAKALSWDTSASVSLTGVSISPDFAQQVNDCCEIAHERGVAVYFSFSPVNHLPLKRMRRNGAATYFRACLDAFDCPIISDPSRYILDSGWFYDSNFHLNSAGAVLRTCLLAENLLGQLGCYEGLSFPRPTMPESIFQAPEEVADSDLFLFSPVGDDDAGCVVSGLTEEGVKQASLTIPAAYEGKPVVGFAAHALMAQTHWKSCVWQAPLRACQTECFKTALDWLGLFWNTLNICVASRSIPLMVLRR